ncbi:cold-shock protein [Afifella sp. IM 167]|uniref:cold-shock protein n=1 Tax=Afifella sp. IM 167 TaxID=2033586 RepID=UPI001CCDF09D|nr:cold-shock protein [Afifella sp. IM 167]MBZ8131666.1 cold-shock protein [Afifella sp. IM 167]
MHTGNVMWFDARRGYGFIRPDEGADIFVHRTALERAGLKTLQPNQIVFFDVEMRGEELTATDLTALN